MGLPEKELTSRQNVVMKPLLERYQMARAKVNAAQKLLNMELQAIGEYSSQIAELTGLDMAKDYIFDVDNCKFVDRVEAAAAEAVKAQTLLDKSNG